MVELSGVKIADRPFLAVRADSALDEVLEKLVETEVQAAKAGQLADYWKLHLAKRGFSATWAMLERLSGTIPAPQLADFQSRTLTICGRDDEEYAFLQTLHAWAWVSTRLLRHDLRTGNLDAALDRILRWKEHAGRGFLPAAVDGLWALGAKDAYEKLRESCDDVANISFFDTVFASRPKPQEQDICHRVLFIERERRRSLLTRVGFASFGIAPEFMPGLDGSILSASLLAHLRIESGQFGCSNSHLRAWETVAASADAGGIIYEVDAAPTLGYSERALQLDRWDFVALNDGAHQTPITTLDCRNITVVETAPFRNQTGTCGYYLSRRMAGHLLEAIARDGLRGHIDIQTFDYMRAPGFDRTLRLGKTSFPLVRHLALGAGTRRAIELNY